MKEKTEKMTLELHTVGEQLNVPKEGERVFLYLKNDTWYVTYRKKFEWVGITQYYEDMENEDIENEDIEATDKWMYTKDPEETG